MNVCVFVFDLLMVDGDVLLKRPLRERRARVAAALPHMTPGFIQLAESIQLHAPSADSTEPQQVRLAAHQVLNLQSELQMDDKHSKFFHEALRLRSAEKWRLLFFVPVLQGLYYLLYSFSVQLVNVSSLDFGGRAFKLWLQDSHCIDHFACQKQLARRGDLTQWWQHSPHSIADVRC